MPISEEKYWKVVCEECGEPFPEEDWGGYVLYETEEEARKSVPDYDGEIASDGKVYCCGCIEERSPANAA